MQRYYCRQLLFLTIDPILCFACKVRVIVFDCLKHAAIIVAFHYDFSIRVVFVWSNGAEGALSRSVFWIFWKTSTQIFRANMN